MGVRGLFRRFGFSATDHGQPTLSRAAIFHLALLLVAVAGWIRFRRGTRAEAARRGCRLWLALAPLFLLASIDLFLSIDYAPPHGSKSVLVMRDPKLHWRFAPGAAGKHGGVDRVINADGFCGPPVPLVRQPGEYRIVFVGDSTTAGYGVAWEETFVARSARLLEEATGRAVVVVNAGVDGYTTRQERLMAEECLRFQPDLIVLGFCLNDLTEYDPPYRWRADSWLRHSGIYQYLQHRRYGPRGTFSAERLREMAPPFLDELFAPVEADRVRKSWETTLAELRTLNQMCRTHRIDFALLYIPASAQITLPGEYGDQPQVRLREFAAGIRATFVDPTEALVRLAAVDPSAGYFDFWHWSAAGHALAAEQLAAELTGRIRLATSP